MTLNPIFRALDVNDVVIAEHSPGVIAPWELGPALVVFGSRVQTLHPSSVRLVVDLPFPEEVLLVRPASTH